MVPDFSIREAYNFDIDNIIAIWQEAGLIRLWNNPANDIKNCLENETSTILLLCSQEQVIGTAMIGYDGHRGWLYYFAIKKQFQGKGLGKKLLKEAEIWLKNKNVGKLNLMVRESNQSVLAFYQNSGYKNDEVITLSKWLK